MAQPDKQARFLICALVLCGCESAENQDGGDATPQIKLDVAITEDMGRSDGMVPDVLADADSLPSCNATEAANIAIDPDGPGTQIHPAAAFDDDGVWVAYNASAGDGSGNLSVRAVKLGCDGGAIIGPLDVDRLGGNSIDPDVAIGETTVMIAWLTDTGEFPNNLSIRYRFYSRAGEPLAESETILETDREGEMVSGNHWQPQIAHLSADRFLIAGSRGLETVGRFQVIVGQIDAVDGRIGPTLEPSPNPDATQQLPSVALAPNGDVYVSFTEQVGDDEMAVHTRLPAANLLTGPFVPTPAAPLLAGVAGAFTDYAGTPDGIYVAWTADRDGLDVLVRDGTDFDNGASLAVGVSDRSDHTPKLAVAPGGGAIAYFRQIQGIQNDVYVMRFTADGELVAGQSARVPTAGPALSVYAPAIAYVGGDTFFVAWSEGQSPDLTVSGRFMEFP